VALGGSLRLKLRHRQLSREKSQPRNIWDGCGLTSFEKTAGAQLASCLAGSSAPEFYPCYSLYDGYGPHGGSVFCGGFTQAGWAR